jgi:hypothetical protein
MMVRAYVRTQGGNVPGKEDAVTVLVRKIVVENKDKSRMTTECWHRKTFKLNYEHKRTIVFPTYNTVPFGYNLE